MQSGRVIKILSDRFVVEAADTVIFVKARKKLKRELSPLCGDIVYLEQVNGEYVLSGIEPRRNCMIRPPIANVDQIIVTIATLPHADFLTVDKMFINAHRIGLRTVLCVNKTDIASQYFISDVYAQYSGVVDEIVTVSAATGEVTGLNNALAQRFSCFAGQSAVGKTSLVNAVCGTCRQVGGVSEKTQRGKNTTTEVELLRIGEDTFIADTPGFGALDLADIEWADLPLYYEEFVRLSHACRYHMCSHSNEPECAVKTAVESGSLNKKRYERYLMLLSELKQKKLRRKSWRNAYEGK